MPGGIRLEEKILSFFFETSLIFTSVYISERIISVPAGFFKSTAILPEACIFKEGIRAEKIDTRNLYSIVSAHFPAGQLR